MESNLIYEGEAQAIGRRIVPSEPKAMGCKEHDVGHLGQTIVLFALAMPTEHGSELDVGEEDEKLDRNTRFSCDRSGGENAHCNGVGNLILYLEKDSEIELAAAGLLRHRDRDMRGEPCQMSLILSNSLSSTTSSLYDMVWKIRNRLRQTRWSTASHGCLQETSNPATHTSQSNDGLRAIELLKAYVESPISALLALTNTAMVADIWPSSPTRRTVGAAPAAPKAATSMSRWLGSSLKYRGVTPLLAVSLGQELLTGNILEIILCGVQSSGERW